MFYYFWWYFDSTHLCKLFFHAYPLGTWFLFVLIASLDVLVFTLLRFFNFKIFFIFYWFYLRSFVFRIYGLIRFIPPCFPCRTWTMVDREIKTFIQRKQPLNKIRSLRFCHWGVKQAFKMRKMRSDFFFYHSSTLTVCMFQGCILIKGPNITCNYCFSLQLLNHYSGVLQWFSFILHSVLCWPNSWNIDF